MDIISIIIFGLVFINVLYDLYTNLHKDKKDKKEKTESPQKSNTSKLDIALTLAAILLVCIGLLYVLFSRIITSKVLLFIISVVYIIATINKTIRTSEPIKNIILKKDTSKEISSEERQAIIAVSSSLYLLIYCTPIRKLESYVLSFPQESIAVEILLSVVCIIGFFLLSFLIIVLLVAPFAILRCITDLIFNQLNKLYNGIMNHIGRKAIDWTPKALLSKQVLSFFYSHNGIFKYMSILLLCVAFILDLFISFIRMVYLFLVYISIASIIEFARWLGSLVFVIVNLITSIPGHKVIKNSFRLAWIISATVLVILMRYEVLYKFEDAFIGITEFIASAIVIPIVFEWIYSNKVSSDTKKEMLNT